MEIFYFVFPAGEVFGGFGEGPLEGFDEVEEEEEHAGVAFWGELVCVD